MAGYGLLSPLATWVAAGASQDRGFVVYQYLYGWMNG